MAREIGLNGRSVVPNGVDLVFLPTSEVGRILALGEPVNFVVEEENFQADVAAQHMNGVISADGKRIAITCGDPYFEVGTNDLSNR